MAEAFINTGEPAAIADRAGHALPGIFKIVNASLKRRQPVIDQRPELRLQRADGNAIGLCFLAAFLKIMDGLRLRGRKKRK